MKAQLKYMEANQKKKDRKGILNAMRHDYLWAPTTTFYIGSSLVFVLLKNRLKLALWQIIPFMMVPVTMDYAKREYYIAQVEQKDREELDKSRKVVSSIIAEKKRLVTLEQVLRYTFRMNLDKKIEKEK